jgi:hypothetical protein
MSSLIGLLFLILLCLIPKATWRGLGWPIMFFLVLGFLGLVAKGLSEEVFPSLGPVLIMALGVAVFGLSCTPGLWREVKNQQHQQLRAEQERKPGP